MKTGITIEELMLLAALALGMAATLLSVPAYMIWEEWREEKKKYINSKLNPKPKSCQANIAGRHAPEHALPQPSRHLLRSRLPDQLFHDSKENTVPGWSVWEE